MKSGAFPQHRFHGEVMRQIEKLFVEGNCFVDMIMEISCSPLGDFQEFPDNVGLVVQEVIIGHLY